MRSFIQLMEKYTENNSALLRYFKDGNFDPYSCWYEICDWLAKNDYMGLFSELIGKPTTQDELEEEDADIFYKLPPEVQKECSERVAEYIMQHDPASAPSTDHMSLSRDRLLSRETWLVHFTDDPWSVQYTGFTYGIDQMDRLGLTTWFKQEAKKYGGYNFAFEAGSRHSINAASQHKYGKHAVLFQNSGVKVYHYGDEEDQVIFWGQDVEPSSIVILSCEYDVWTVVDVRNSRNLFSGEFQQAVNWVKKNFTQYRRSITRPKVVTEDQRSSPTGKSLYQQGKSVVTIYRACEGSVETFNPMDYVTLSRKFAIEHAEHMAAVEDKPYVVISKVVSGMDVYDAYNPGEYFYDGPQIKARVIARSNPVLDEGYRKFPEYPENRLAPSDSHHRTGRSRGDGLRGPHESKELGLMLAGKKPAAMLPLIKELPDVWKKAIEQNGWAYRHIGDTTVENGSIVVTLPGEEYRIDRLDKIYANVRRRGGMTRADHIKIGRLLGYTKDDIMAFIHHRYGGPVMHVK
jgi:hypothetical protein